MKPTAMTVSRFRGWRSEHRITLDASITAIVAENARGKSSLLNAIEWCLYGAVVTQKGSGIDERQNWELRTRSEKDDSEPTVVMLELETAEGYAETMIERGVVVDPAERRRRLEALAETLASKADARVHPDPELMAEHVELVEWPGLIAGTFDERLLELPPEVVVTTLRYHQKCLILENGDNGLQNAFIGVIDRKDDPEGLIRQGN